MNTTKYVSATTFASGATIIVANAHAAGAKALIGIGGDEASGYSQAFDQATTPANLSTFVANIVSLMQQYGFDGVDINWEQIGAYTGRQCAISGVHCSAANQAQFARAGAAAHHVTRSEGKRRPA